MEYLNFTIAREVFAKIARFPDARMKIGNSEFKFTPEHLKTFDALAKNFRPVSFSEILFQITACIHI